MKAKIREENFWTILSSEYRNKRKHYLVRCKCGYEGYREARNVDSNRSTCCKSCSTKMNDLVLKNLKLGAEIGRLNAFTIGELTGQRFALIRYGAIRRNLSFNVTLDFIWNLFLKQDRKCAVTGIKLTFKEASLDRIDSTQGYEENNIQWVHKRINIMKNDMSQQEFVEYLYYEGFLNEWIAYIFNMLVCYRILLINLFQHQIWWGTDRYGYCVKFLSCVGWPSVSYIHIG